MNPDQRATVLAALREIYDGAWVRHVGTDGGRRLGWTGKVGLIAGCTPTIDRHHGVIGAVASMLPPTLPHDGLRRLCGKQKPLFPAAL